MFFVIVHSIQWSKQISLHQKLSWILSWKRTWLVSSASLTMFYPYTQSDNMLSVFAFASISWLRLPFLSSSLTSSHLVIVFIPLPIIQIFFLLVGISCSVPSVLPSPASIFSQHASTSHQKVPRCLPQCWPNCLPFRPPLGLESNTEPSPGYFSC